MKSVYKYIVSMAGYQELTLPINSRVLSVTEQNEKIVLYALVDTTTRETETVQIIVHGTGHPANDVDNYTFLGTVALMNGMFMLHIFYNKNKGAMSNV